MGQYQWNDLTPSQRAVILAAIDAALADSPAAPQIAAKTTATTPAAGSGGSGPGLYALASAAVEDGGWTKVDVNSHGVDLLLSAGDGNKNLVEAYTSDDLDVYGAYTSSLSVAAQTGTNYAVDPHAAANIYVQADDSQAAAYVAVGPSGQPGNDGSVAMQGSSGQADLIIVAAPGQISDLIFVRMADAEADRPVFAVDPGGPIMFSPDGSRHRLKVANDGTLTTESA